MAFAQIILHLNAPSNSVNSQYRVSTFAKLLSISHPEVRQQLPFRHCLQKMKLFQIDFDDLWESFSLSRLLMIGDGKVVFILDTAIICAFPSLPAALTINAWDRTSQVDLEW